MISVYSTQQHMISILPLCDICGQCWLPECSKSKQSFYSHLVFTLPAPSSSSPNLGLVLPPRVSPVCPVWPPVAPAAVADGRGVAECGRAALQSSPVLPGRQHVLFCLYSVADLRRPHSPHSQSEVHRTRRLKSLSWQTSSKYL